MPSAKLGGMRTIWLVWVLAFLVGCNEPEPPPTPAPDRTQHSAVQPERDQVSFFERPLTLAAMRRSGAPSPIIVLLENDPWAEVVGSGSPSFALYDDGSVIQQTASGFTTARLSEREVRQLLERLRPNVLSRFYGRFDVADATDQPDQDLLIYSGERPVFVSVYGSLRQDEIRSRIPEPIVAAYDTLTAFAHPGSLPWLPEYVEVMIWPYEYAPDPSIQWPSDWPGLDDSRTVRRGEDSFSIYLPSARLPELRSFLEGRNERGAVEIGGRKWSASIRFPFPQEQLWMAPHPELDSTPH